MVAAAWFGAYALRFNLHAIPPEFADAAWRYLPWALVTQAIAFRVFGLYRGIWRFASLRDLERIAKAVAIGAATLAIGLFLVTRLAGVPRSVLPLYMLLQTLLLCLPRFVFRSWKDRVASFASGKRTLIVGAGRAGELLVRDLLLTGQTTYQPVAFVDDDRAKRGQEIHGLRVVGGTRNLPNLVAKFDIEAILIAIPSASNAAMQLIVTQCENTGLPFLTLPSVEEVLASAHPRESLREVSILDLLGRDPIEIDRKLVSLYLSGRHVLVTGGGGSIGSELCKQLAQFGVSRLTIFDKCEFNLYSIDHSLRAQYPALEIHSLLGDITDRAAVKNALKVSGANLVFHAAAYKHVPLLETQIREAVLNNVIGTGVLIAESVAYGIADFVLISTDKAVNPTNVMGKTKRAAELLAQNANRLGTTRFVTVRFGNVLDSAGSVVPLFRNQLARGGPLTVTHPEVTRYFMTIPEACQLIALAAATGNGGEIFVLDMGEPIKIHDLAEQMIRLAGKQPHRDIRIELVGLRPGEKLHEQLFYAHEFLKKTPHSKLLLADSKAVPPEVVEEALRKLESGCIQFNDESLTKNLDIMIDSGAGNGRDFSPADSFAGQESEPSLPLPVLPR